MLLPVLELDNPNTALSLPEQRHALLLQQEAWHNYKPQHITISKVPCSHKITCTSRSITPIPVILSAIVGLLNQSKVWTGCGRVFALYRGRMTTGLRLLFRGKRSCRCWDRVSPLRFLWHGQFTYLSLQRRHYSSPTPSSDFYEVDLLSFP